MNTAIEITIDALIHQWQECKKQVAQTKTEQLAIEKALWDQLKQSPLVVFEELEDQLSDFIKTEPDHDGSVPFSLLIPNKLNGHNGNPAKLS